MNKVIFVGSSVFFSGLDGFTPGDIDILLWEEKSKRFNNFCFTYVPGVDVFEYTQKPKEEFLAYAKRDDARGFEFGSFLVPEFVSLIGLTIDELKELREAFAGKLNEKQQYQLSICDSYIANGDFTLTDSQRQEAFEIYQSAKNNKVESFNESD